MNVTALTIFVALAVSCATASPTLELRGGGRANGVSCRRDQDCQSHYCAQNQGRGKCHKRPQPHPHPHPHPQPPPPTNNHPHPHPAPHPHPGPPPHPVPAPRPQPGPHRGPLPGPQPQPGRQPGKEQPPPGQQQPPPPSQQQPPPPGQQQPPPSQQQPPVTGPTSGVFSFLDSNGQPGELLGDNGGGGAGTVTTVEAAETWTLGSKGQLTDPQGNVLVTDGSRITVLPGDASSSLATYACTLDSTSTSDTAVLDCTATPSSGTASSFVLCNEGSVAASPAACQEGVEKQFDHFILGPARAVQPPAQPPTTGTLSFIGSQSQVLGEVVDIDSGTPEGTEPLEVVTQGQTWTLNTDGNLVSSSGGLLQTDGQAVYDSPNGQIGGSHYVCSIASGSTPSVAALDCAAVVPQDDGTYDTITSFVICDDGRVQTNEPNCNSFSTTFTQLSLTRV